MREDAGKGRDEFERAFDEDFVRGATATEDDWRTRKKQSRKRAKKDARQARRARRRHRAAFYAWRVGGIAVIAGLVVVLAGMAGVGPLSGLRPDDTPSPGATSPLPRATRPGETTTTIFHLDRRSYRLGDCIIFDQRPGNDTRPTTVVPCAKPHLLEMTTSLDVGNRFDHFPSEAEWHALFDHDCGPSISALLRAPVDPQGLYFAAGVQPSAESWADGDRTVWCGVGKVPDAAPPHADDWVAFTGKVDGMPQARVGRVGACYSNDAAYPVPCSKAHTFEVSGTVDLTGKVEQPPAPNDDSGWQRLVGDQCYAIGRAYLGHDPVDDQGAGWQPIEPGSWAAGRRVAECTVARFRNNRAIPTIGSLRGA